MNSCCLNRQIPVRILYNSCFVALVLFLLSSGLACKEETKGGPRVEVIPITGKLTLDGKPAEGVVIYFNRTSERKVDFGVPNPEGKTDKEGTISATTYHIGDGAPAGDYTLTFEWPVTNPLTGQPSGDRFGGKFVRVANSPHKVTVPENSDEVPYDIGTIKLSTKGE